MSAKPWDFWAGRYDRLWVQKHSLGPTREYILEELAPLMAGEVSHNPARLLDLGCGTGQLLEEIALRYEGCSLTGIDFSEKMLQLSSERNPSARHLKLDAMDIGQLEETFDIITCTHSLPYYREAKAVLHGLAGRLDPAGRLLIGFASGNSWFDRLILAGVKLTTGKAAYPSDRLFRAMIEADYDVVKLNVIKRAVYMPRIAIYTLALKKAGREEVL